MDHGGCGPTSSGTGVVGTPSCSAVFIDASQNRDENERTRLLDAALLRPLFGAKLAAVLAVTTIGYRLSKILFPALPPLLSSGYY